MTIVPLQSMTLADAAVRAIERLYNDKDPSVLDQLFAPDLVQHTPHLDNGIAPLRQLAYLLAAHRHRLVTVHRAVTEGDLAAVHAHYTLDDHLAADGRGLAVVDLFRFDGGLIAEHWRVAQPVPAEIVGGVSMFDGGGNPDAAVQPALLQVNKDVVTGLYLAISTGDTNTIASFASANLVEHNPTVGNGLRSVADYFERRGPMLIRVHRLIAQGDLVFAHVHYRDTDAAAVDIFRLEDGMIREHWDVSQPIPSRTVSGHGMF